MPILRTMAGNILKNNMWANQISNLTSGVGGGDLMEEFNRACVFIWHTKVDNYI